MILSKTDNFLHSETKIDESFSNLQFFAECCQIVWGDGNMSGKSSSLFERKYSR